MTIRSEAGVMGRRGWRMALAIKCVVALAVCVMLSVLQPAGAYIEVAYTLGKLVNDSTNIMLLQVESVDKVKNTITYRKIEDIKGKHPTDVVKHNIAQAGFHPREWQNIMAWAEVGQYAVFCHNNGASETCINNYWYQCYPGGEWWNFYHAEPYLLRTYAGKPETLAKLIKQMLAGQEVAVTAMVDGDKNALHMRTARTQRLKASTKIQDYDQKRDFLGWGGEGFKPIASMPGFSHYAALPRMSPGAAATLAFDFDGDGKTDFLLLGENRVSLFKNEGTSASETMLPVAEGARGAAVGLLHNNKFPDIVLATPTGPRLLTNLGEGKFRDDSASLPAQTYHNTLACAVLDFDGDGRADILLSDGFTGLRLLKNVTPADAGKDAAPKFEDVSDQVGLGSGGMAAGGRAHTLLVADVNSDGRPDVLLFGDVCMVLLNTGNGFTLGTALDCQPTQATPALAQHQKVWYLAVPQPGAVASKVLLYRGDGQGRFENITASPLLSFEGEATSVALADFDNSGRLDVLVGVLRAPNRVFANGGDNTFTDVSDALGLTQKIFNTRGLAVLDLNRDSMPDLLLNNEGQDSVLLLGNAARKEKQ